MDRPSRPGSGSPSADRGSDARDRGSTDDRPLHELHDDHDREELRSRYYGLTQELRVLLPGAQVLEAVLLAAPFSERFADLDELGRRGYVISLTAGMLAVVALMAPPAIHRVGDRRARVSRLEMANRLVRVGVALVGVALVSCLFVVVRFVFGNDGGAAVAVLTGTAMLALWLVVPLLLTRRVPTDDRDELASDPQGLGTTRDGYMNS